MIITVPVQISFESWANDLIRTMPMLTIPIPTEGVNNWWGWVNSLVDINRLYDLPGGDKSTFPNVEDWKKWVYLFIQTLQTQTIN